MGILAKHEWVGKIKKVSKLQKFINRLIDRYLDYINRKFKI